MNSSEMETLKMDNSSEKRTWMTVKEVAEYLHLAVNTVYHKTRAKKNPIPHSKATGKLLFDLEQVNEWMGIGSKKLQTKGRAAGLTSKLQLSDFYAEKKSNGRRASLRI
ncbi:MAG TPA: helix-turn-helix domain-containing protein [Bacteroidales bacterium]|nr:helix-turn-helix domain-containing protein [Bacteroidales bacterium]